MNQRAVVADSGSFCTIRNPSWIIRRLTIKCFPVLFLNSVDDSVKMGELFVIAVYIKAVLIILFVNH